MLKHRLIAVIIIRDGQVVQSEKFKHTNVIHYDAFHAVEAFNSWSVDEVILLNVSKSHSSKNEFLEIVKHVSKTCFVPLAVGGHIDSLDYGSSLIFSGADKLIINSLWSVDVNTVHQLSEKFGKQCIVASIDVKMNSHNVKEVYIDRGCVGIEYNGAQWAKFCEKNGAGEIFINNIDHDGNRRGYDLETIKLISKNIQIPIIAFGGVFNWKHLLEGLESGADAVAAANIFHYKEMAIKQAKRYLLKHNIKIRN
jgi:imidazole glycerol-phosphate synthase subunit HisF